MMWEILTSVALILTLFVVLWYAWETRRLRIETIKQTELSLRPFVIILFIEHKNKFILKNIGNGPALKVKIDDIPLIKENKLYIKYIFHEIDVILAKEESEIKCEIKTNDSTLNISLFSHFFPHTAVKSYNFLIRYTNINNELYQTKGKFGKGGIVIEGIKKLS
ncbi:MAG: hypothetical protein AB1410_03845 [Acidobacteriota bacterium]